MEIRIQQHMGLDYHKINNKEEYLLWTPEY